MINKIILALILLIFLNFNFAYSSEYSKFTNLKIVEKIVEIIIFDITLWEKSVRGGQCEWGKIQNKKR